MVDDNIPKRRGRPAGSRSGYTPGWLRKQFLDEIRRRGTRAVMKELKTDKLIDNAIKVEPKDINTQTQVNIRIVSLPSKVRAGTAIEPAEYKVLNSSEQGPKAIGQTVDDKDTAKVGRVS